MPFANLLLILQSSIGQILRQQVFGREFYDIHYRNLQWLYGPKLY
jgi:hypothetical protein